MSGRSRPFYNLALILDGQIQVTTPHLPRFSRRAAPLHVAEVVDIGPLYLHNAAIFKGLRHKVGPYRATSESVATRQMVARPWVPWKSSSWRSTSPYC